jgi:L-fuculose-phosphate aldolase
MDDAEYALREEIVESCRRMAELGINQGTSGNVSARWRNGLLVTPSGLDYDAMAPEDIVLMAMDGSCDGALAPSSEWRFHRDILKSREEIGAVVHAHPIYCTAIAMARREIPAVHYMIAAAGGPTVRCAPYATFGTEALSKHALKALEGRMCCLLANHGMIACGASLAKALWLAGELETLARQYVVSLQIGEPHVLPDDEIASVVEKFKSYGPRAKDGG